MLRPATAAGAVASGAVLLVLGVGAGVGIGVLVDAVRDGNPSAAGGSGPFIGPVATSSRPRVGPPADVLDPADRLSLDGLGPVHIGMSLRQAAAAAGEPLEQVDDGGCAYAVPSSPPGVRFQLRRGRVARVDVGADATVRTLSGIAVGARTSQVRAVYGDRLTPEESGLLFTPGDARYLVRFDVADDRVVSFSGGTAEAVASVDCR